MAYFTIKLYSNSLCRGTSFEMIIPNDKRDPAPWDNDASKEEKPMRTLFLLHGYTGSAWSWIPEELAAKYNVALVMPNGENGFWLDGRSTGHKYCTFIGEELPNYINKTFGLDMSPENLGVLGFSMGGFGALHTALAYPERFGKAGAMSSALIVHGVADMKEGEGNDVANYDYYNECFGNPAEVLTSENNPETLVDKLIRENKKLPDIYMCCGTEDFLLGPNRDFHSFLESRNVDHVYKESKGGHDFVFWNEYSEKILEWMFG